LKGATILLTDDKLTAYIENFWGYGDLSAPIWFVGMEEGGETDETSFNAMLNNWEKAGRPQVVDIHPTENAEDNRWFNTDNPPIQRTWGKLIRAVLQANCDKVSNDTIRSYQRHRLGRPSGETCLLELMPLPAPATKNWPYRDLSNLAILESRRAYMDGICPNRIYSLRNIIKEWRPKIVVFYSASYLNFWKEVVGYEKVWMEFDGWKRLKDDETHFYCIKHPTSHGATNALYDELGCDMRRVLLG
jgi:hypothetical protein